MTATWCACSTSAGRSSPAPKSATIFVRERCRFNEGGWYNPAEPAEVGSLDNYGDVNVLAIDIGHRGSARAIAARRRWPRWRNTAGKPPDTEVFNTPRGA